MKLVSFEVLPSRVEGWSSTALEFGQNITQLYGPNGAGKTPLIGGILYALGCPYNFRQDILSKCDSVRLIVQVSEQTISISRSLHEKFELTVIQEGEDKPIEFYSESAFSNFLFELCQIPRYDLVATNNSRSHAYISTLAPVFFTKQDY